RAGFVLLKLASLPDRPGPSAVRALSPAAVGAGVHRRAYRLRQDRAGRQEPDGYPHLQPLPAPQVFRGELRRRDRAAGQDLRHLPRRHPRLGRDPRTADEEAPREDGRQGGLIETGGRPSPPAGRPVRRCLSVAIAGCRPSSLRRHPAFFPKRRGPAARKYPPWSTRTTAPPSTTSAR